MGFVIPIVCLIVGLLLVWMGAFSFDYEEPTRLWTWFLGFPMIVYAIIDLRKKKNWKKL